jgi:apolipoprotein N-acyltransferase
MLVSLHPPLELGAIVWVALVPWLVVVVRAPTTRVAILQALWLELLVGFGWGWWLPEAVADFFSVPVSAGFVALVLNAAIHQLHWLPFAWCVRHASARTSSARGTAIVLFLLPAAYCAFDWLLPGIFQHGLGAALHDWPRLRQAAAIGGVPMLTGLVLLVNLAIAVVLRAGLGRDGSGPRSRVVGVAVAAASLPFAAALLYGEHRLDELAAAHDAADRTLRVAIVQGNVEGEIKRRWSRGDLDAARQALDVYLDETRRLLALRPRPELVVWPETAYPGIYRRPENEGQARLNAFFDRFIHTSGVPVVFGAYDREERMDRRVLQNALFAVQAEPGQARTALSPSQRYVKTILFPLGETLPWSSSAGETSRFWPTARFSPGDGPAVLSIRRPQDGSIVRIGPLICYEDLFTSHVAALERLGADLLVNVSNDAWFGDRGEPRLHLIYARLRSVELGLPQVRVTNTGYSAVIHPSGEIPHVTAYGARAADLVTLSMHRPSGRTLVARWGDWFGGACAGIVVLAGAFDFVARRAWRISRH